jgi:hypothetical protein
MDNSLGKITVYSKRVGGLNPPVHGNHINCDIDRSNSLLGNPFPLKNRFDDAERYLCIDKYEKYIESKLMSDDRVLQEFKMLIEYLKNGIDVNLICWCKEGNREVPCHGDVIKKILEELM